MGMSAMSVTRCGGMPYGPYLCGMRLAKTLRIRRDDGERFWARIILKPIGLKPNSPVSRLTDELERIIRGYAFTRWTLPLSDFVGLIQSAGGQLDCVHGMRGEVFYIVGNGEEDSLIVIVEPVT